MEGQLKFSVRLDKWPWAQNGRSVDVDVIMKVPPGRAVRRKNNMGRGRPVAFELGADAKAYFSTKVVYVLTYVFTGSFIPPRI